jgi:hypothetical protein
VTDADNPNSVDGVDGTDSVVGANGVDSADSIDSADSVDSADSTDSTDNTESDHDHTDVRYLDAKASVDDRAFSRRVRDRLLAALPAAPTVFDAACGTGVALDRLREWGVESGSNVGFATGDAIAAAERVATGDSVATRDSAVAGDSVTTGDSVGVGDEPVGDVNEPVTAPDLVVAGCFLDLVPVETALDAFTAAAAPGGLVYAPFSFDGTTEFTPAHRADDLVTEIFHAQIDAHDGRDSGAGRAAVDYCRRADGRLLAVDAADWVVRPTADGEYPNDERYFLATILGPRAPRRHSPTATKRSRTCATGFRHDGDSWRTGSWCISRTNWTYCTRRRDSPGRPSAPPAQSATASSPTAAAVGSCTHRSPNRSS